MNPRHGRLARHINHGAVLSPRPICYYCHVAKIEQKASNWHKLAEEVLQASKLRDILSGYGELQFTGSYSNNLLMSSDVDVYVIAEKPTRDLAVKLLNELIAQDWWNNYELADWVQPKFRSEKWGWLPEGYYIQLKLDYKGHRWKVDIWLLNQEQASKHDHKDLLKDLSAENRQAILEFKQAKNNGSIELSSYQIYQMVINQNIKTIKDYEQFHKLKKSLVETIEDKNTTIITDKDSEYQLYTDGGSRGNPGPSAGAYLVLDPAGKLIKKEGYYLGITTNNQAEYQALRHGMEQAAGLGIKNLNVYMDSLLIVNQMKGIYKVKNRELWPIYQSAKETCSRFSNISFTHVPREMNKEADTEVNRVLDEQK